MFVDASECGAETNRLIAQLVPSRRMFETIWFSSSVKMDT